MRTFCYSWTITSIGLLFSTEVTHFSWILSTVILKHQTSSSKQTFSDPGPGPSVGNCTTQSPVFHSQFLFYSCSSGNTRTLLILILALCSHLSHPCHHSSSTVLLHFPENLAFVEITLKVSPVKFHSERDPWLLLCCISLYVFAKLCHQSPPWNSHLKICPLSLLPSFAFHHRCFRHRGCFL